MLRDYLGHIVDTFFGMYHRPYNAKWDRKLSFLLDNFECLEFVDVDECTVTLVYNGNAYSVWISNRWYAYAHLYRFNAEHLDDNMQFRPRFRTMRRLHALMGRYRADEHSVRQREIDTYYGRL